MRKWGFDISIVGYRVSNSRRNSVLFLRFTTELSCLYASDPWSESDGLYLTIIHKFQRLAPSNTYSITDNIESQIQTEKIKYNLCLNVFLYHTTITIWSKTSVLHLNLSAFSKLLFSHHKYFFVGIL